MRKLVSLTFDEFVRLRFAITLAIQHYNRLSDGLFSDSSLLDALEDYDKLMKKLSNTFNSKRKPEFD